MIKHPALFGLPADFEQRMLLANGAVLGHVASGLPHKPDGSALDRLRLTGANEERIGRRHESITVAFSGELRGTEQASALVRGGRFEIFNTEGTGVHRVARRGSLISCVAGRTLAVVLAMVGMLLVLAGIGAQDSSEKTKTAAPAFYKDIVPILQEKCQSCHRSGEPTPRSSKRAGCRRGSPIRGTGALPMIRR